MTMRLLEITSCQFGELFTLSHVYNSASFAMLNESKVDGVHYLAIAEGSHKPRLGIVLGERGDSLLSPFSAPFGGFVECEPQSIEYMEEAVGLIVDYADEKHMTLRVILPPMVYDESQLSKWVSVFSRAGFRSEIELNYHFSLSRFPKYTSFIDRSARKNLNRSLKENFSLVHLDSADRDSVARAYDVIRINREEHGYPLRMTFEQVWQTVDKVVHADFFVLTHDSDDVAAAQIFHVAPKIAQVIYWGDKRQYSSLRPMNYLAYALFEYYYKQGFKILDIGPATENGIPNYGLCKFKENIGCEATLKYSFHGAI